jgi:hypothetical protein
MLNKDHCSLHNIILDLSWDSINGLGLLFKKI